MLKNTLSIFAATIAIFASASLPAAAAELGEGCVLNNATGLPDCPEPPRRVPEPSTILGSIVVGGALLGKKSLDAKKASK